jgi:NADH-ubiquinone oxidoreductase chain 5
MAAPTPVSALVHSSTLVTAGVFLLIRFYPFISTFSLFHSILLLSSTLTILIARAVALIETDIKKIIALSTLSQLGVIIISLALHLDALTFFHLLSHALFKALLFITAGAIIHLSLHSQDLRTTRNTHSLLPITLSCILTANAALMGIPFLAGFYSKDIILEIIIIQPFSIIIITLALFSTALTSSYSTRIIYILI